MTERDDEADAPDEEHGLTDEDMKRIAAFCAKQRFKRSPDDLRPSKR